MINKKVINALNEQMNKEIYSGYLYLGMASYAFSLGLKGVFNWFIVQMREEFVHAEKFYAYINQHGGKVALKAIDEPPQVFSSVLDLFEKTLEHEKKVTGLINDLVKLVRAEDDNATYIFLQWFVTEQIEEEANPTEIIQKLKLIGKDGNGLLLIDNELGQRVFTPPPVQGAIVNPQIN